MKTFEETTSLAELMTIAVDDMEELMNDTNYLFNAHYWHNPDEHLPSICRICMAGAVMANSLKCPKTIERFPRHYDIDTYHKLHAIESARTGDIEDAYYNLGKFEVEVDAFDVTQPHFIGRAAAWDFMRFWREEGIPELKRIETCL